jgi:hypothetical protein
MWAHKEEKIPLQFRDDCCCRLEPLRTVGPGGGFEVAARSEISQLPILIIIQCCIASPRALLFAIYRNSVW